MIMAVVPATKSVVVLVMAVIPTSGKVSIACICTPDSNIKCCRVDLS